MPTATHDRAVTKHPGADHASPRALRLRRVGWRDPRLLLGVSLVGLSVLLGSWVVGTADRTHPVLVATGALVPGDVLTPGAVEVRDVRLPAGTAEYVAPDGARGRELVLTRAVGAGELVAWSAVADDADLGLRPVAVVPGARPSSAVVPGASVDLWFVPAAPGATGAARAPGGAPSQLAAGLTVAEVSDAGGSLSVGAAVTVHVLVPTGDLPTVLRALADDGSVEVVPVPGTASR